MLYSMTFIVPCYNEQDNLRSTIESILWALSLSEIVDFEIIIVDDCSYDNTLSVAKNLAKDNESIKVLRNEINMNLGGAYKYGLSEATKNYVMLVPGDNGFNKDNIALLLNYTGKSDIIIPYIINSNIRPLSRRLLHHFFTAFMNFIFWCDVKYYNGPVIHRRDLISSIKIQTNSFAYQAEALVKLIASGYRFDHVGIEVQEREGGVSSALSWKNQKAVLITIIRLAFEIGIFRRFRIPSVWWMREG